jgi:uridylate kinase
LAKDPASKIQHSRRKVVLKLSGSAFFSDCFSGIARALKDYSSSNNESLIVVAGGGRNARDLIRAGSELSIDQATLDQIGIAITRLNAAVLIAALGGRANETVAESLDSVVDSTRLAENKVVLCGGLHPGQSTNAVGALISEKIRADLFVNATDVDGVYDKDPNVFKSAKLLRSISPSRLSRILSSGSMAAGGYDLMDPVALAILERSRIPTLIVRCDPKILQRALSGTGTSGTRLNYSS